MSERKRASAFDMPAIADKKPDDPKTKAAIEQLADDSGYTVRHAKEAASKTHRKPRRRRLAQAPRAQTVQLNIAVEEETRDRFWDLAEGAQVTNGEGFLIALMDAYESQK